MEELTRMQETNSEVTSAATNWLDANAEGMFDCLARWVACNSAFPNELPIQRDHVEPFLREQLRLDEVARVNVCQEAERPFVVGVWRGAGGGQSLLLNGHIDTIGAPGTMRERWTTDPWQPVVKEGKLYGRGSSDMKAGVVAMPPFCSEIAASLPSISGRGIARWACMGQMSTYPSARCWIVPKRWRR
jgi:acetylornithine deacetylase/succinyl-diaminopimelate desuccinylase-like protein